MKKTIILLILGLTLVISGCGIKPRSWEAEGVIAVMADQGDWDAAEVQLKQVYERIIRTPQIETTYTLRHISDDEFEAYTSYKYIILMGTLESKGKIGDLVNNVVSNPTIKAQVEKGERFWIRQENVWAADQVLLILVAKDEAALNQQLRNFREDIYYVFDSIITQRLAEQMFEKKEQLELEDRFMSTFNWTMRIQHDYFVAQEFPREGFLWMRRLYPERWIFVRWIEDADPSMLTEEWVIKERNRIGETYYDGDVITDHYLFSYAGEFKGRPAQITQGLWEHPEKTAGGPFKNYTFYDKNTKRIYMIDFAIYAPERDKMPYIKRHEVIANSFKTVFDVEID